MSTRTDIEIIFSVASGAMKARDTAKALIWGFYKNGREFLRFADTEKQNADGWRHYPERYVKSEAVHDFKCLWHEYWSIYRDIRRKGADEIPRNEEAEELAGRITRRGNRLEISDFSGPWENENIANLYFEDFFSMLVFMLASEFPEITFEGMKRLQDPDSRSKYSRTLTHAVYDGETLTFEQMEGDPVYYAYTVSWMRDEDRFIKSEQTFPSVRVDILADDHESVRNDAELDEWIRGVNDVDMEMAAAELCFKHESVNPYPHVVITGASQEICTRYCEELLELLSDKGYRAEPVR